MRQSLVYTKDTKGNILISLSRHHYVQAEDGTFIDGGQDPHDYVRTNGEVYRASVDELIPILRKRVTWTSVYDENNNRLDSVIRRYIYELHDAHLVNIVKHLNQSIRNWEIRNQPIFAEPVSNMQQIILAEIIYRSLHKIYDKELID